MRKAESLTARASWLTFAKTLGFAFSIALPLILARRMNQEQYGLYKQVFLVVNTAAVILPLGFSMSAYYFLAREQGRQRETVLNILLFHVVVGALAALALLLYPSILGVIFGGPQLQQYSHLIGIAILLWITSGILETIPIAHQEIKLATAFIISIQASRAAIFITAAILFGTVHSLIWAAILHGIIQTIMLLGYLQSRFGGFWRSFDWHILRDQLSYAIPLGSAGLLLTLQSDLHNYFVSNQFGPALFAIYTFGTLQIPLMTLIQEATNSVLITQVSVLQQQQKERDIILLMARAARKLAAVYFPVYGLLLVVGPEFLRFLFTEQYAGSWPIFAINLTLLPLGVLLLDPLFRAYRSERYFLLRLRIILLVTLIVALSLWTRQLGLTGVVAVVVVTGIVERAATLIHFGRLLGVTTRDIILLRDLGKLAAASAAAGLACAALRSLLGTGSPFTVLAVCGPAFACVYLVAIHFLRVLSPDEYDQLREGVASLRWLAARDNGRSVNLRS
jgi:O-antigen/teichoic acid export membrane protein